MSKYIPALIISIVLALIAYVVAIVWSSDHGMESLASISPLVWAEILGLSLFNYALRFARWQWYIRHLSGARIPWFDHLQIYFAGFALTTTPGKAGEAIRSLYLKSWDVGLANSISALFVERLVDMVAIIFLSVYALLSLDNPLFRYFSMAIIAGFVICLPLLHVQILWKTIESRAARLPRPLHSAVVKICRLVESSAQILKNRHLYGGLVVGVVSWAAEGVGFYILVNALGIPLDLPMAVGVYGVAVLAGAISFMPGGLGGAEAAMGIALVSLGADHSAAVVATVVCRIATLWFAVILGAFACLVLTQRKIYPKWGAPVSQ